MKKEIKEKILKRFAKKSQSNLIFSVRQQYWFSATTRDKATKLLNSFKKKSSRYTRENLILKIVQLSRYLSTKTQKNSNFQCHDGAYRSAGDIFRIAKAYTNKKITLPQVMRILYKLTHARSRKISSHYCTMVRKRVFKVSKYSVAHSDFKDEFGLKFSEWR